MADFRPPGARKGWGPLVFAQVRWFPPLVSERVLIGVMMVGPGRVYLIGFTSKKGQKGSLVPSVDQDFSS